MGASLPLNAMYDFLLDCGRYRDPEAFSKHILDKIDGLIPFEQARLYFLNDNGAVYDEYLLGVDKQVVEEYHQYYSQVDGGNYAITKRARDFQKAPLQVEDCVFSWSKYGQEEVFFQEYVKPYQIRHSFGLFLRDTQNTMKCLFSLDRISDIPFSETDISIMAHIHPHLDNLYQNFYVPPPATIYVKNRLNADLPLTSREYEIALLLSQGVTPIHISEKLCLSTTTVKKHIQNMHTKLHVSTRQELIIKLLSSHR